MISIEVFSEEKAWSKKLKKKEFFFKEICNLFPRKYRFISKKISLTLLLSNNKCIKKLNKKFRNKNKSTDVLSFPFYEKKKLKIEIKKSDEIYLGDIIINLNMIRNKSNIAKFKEELNNLWVHGLVHLFGYKHKKDRDFNEMSRIEKRFIKYLN